jgi:ABC-type polysaccharide/polyol phosphate transport system ATPase subunit
MQRTANRAAIAGLVVYLALNGIDLRFMSGEQVAVLGAHRSGKTTLLRLLAGSIHPTEGTISYEGRVFDPAWLGRFQENVLVTSTTEK